MGRLRTAARLLRDPGRFGEVLLEKIHARLARLNPLSGVPREFYLSRQRRVETRYQARLGMPPNLRRPTKFTEKVQWRKLYCPEISLFARLSDKLEVMEYVRERIGDDHLLPVLWVGEAITAADVRALGDGVVIKPTHRSGQVVIVEHQADVHADVVAAHFSRALRWPYSMMGEEPWYGWQNPRIFAQPLIWSPTGSKYIQDVKFHVFAQPEGSAKIVCEVINTTPHWRAIYDENFERLPFDWSPIDYPPPLHDPAKPDRFDEMLSDALSLAEGIDYVRVDFLLGSDNYYFSEMTFAPVGGRPLMEPREWDGIVGSWWHLDTGTPLSRLRWRIKAWAPLWKTENPARLIRRLHRYIGDIYLPGIRHSDYLKAASRLEDATESVALVTTGVGTQGVMATTNWYANLVSGFRRSGVDAWVVASAQSEAGPLIPALLQGNVLTLGGSLDRRQRVALIEDADFLLVHPGALGWALEAASGVQSRQLLVVLSLECPSVTMAADVEGRDRFVSAVVENAQGIVTMSEETEQFWLQAGIAADAIHMVKTAINVPDLPEPQPRPRGANALYSGNLANEEVWDLLDVAVAVRAQVPGFRLIVRGASPDAAAAAFAAEVERRGLADFVFVKAAVPMEQLRVEQVEADVLLAPQRDTPRAYVGFPSKVGEYLASGSPVVCSAVPALEGVAVDGETAFVAPMGDIEAFSSRAVVALTNPSLAESIGSAGRERITRVADSKTIASEMLRWLKALERRRG